MMVALAERTGKERHEIKYEKFNLRDVNCDGSLITIGSGEYKTTDRFWNSIFSRFGIGNNVFKYFSHNEVFKRICKTLDNDVPLRFSHDDHRVYAVSPCDRDVTGNYVYDILDESDAISYYFDDGVVKASFEPKSGDTMSMIMNDDHKHRFMMNIPLDGYGSVNTYLAMLRVVCANGMVAMAPAFRSKINIGKSDSWIAIKQAIDHFNNSEGYEAIAARLESATKSWASLYEYKKVIGSCLKSIDRARNKKALQKIVNMSSDILRMYGVAHIDAISPKKQRVLRSNMRVYDLINFATEFNTHFVKRRESSIDGTIGDLISSEYDLELSAADRPYEPAEFHLAS